MESSTNIPRFLYGTAWKEDETERLTRLAIDQGFRGIDTANQRKHYFEAGVGAAVRSAITDGVVTRGDLFLQTKFTYRAGQDQRLPYDAAAPPATQVRQSLASSLEHLGVETIDSYVLHGPSRRRGLGADDHEVWRAMEDLVASGAVTALGVSNVSLDQLDALCAFARIRPMFVQNRCFARTGWDRDVREFCRRNGIRYQAFSLLTANRHELQERTFVSIRERLGWTSAQIVFTFAHAVGMLPLTGTTKAAHMQEDLRALELTLSDGDIQAIEAIGERI